MVPVNTVADGISHDDSCYLHYHDHPFIEHKSFVKYRFLDLRNADKLCAGVARGLFVPREELNEDIFEQVCHGLIMSKHVRQKMRTFYCNAD